MTFNVILNSVDNPGRFTFITVEDAADEYCYDMGHLYIHAHVDYMDDDELAKYTN